MPFERGAVYSAPLLLLGRGDDADDDRRKYLIVLQSPAAMDRNASQFAFVVASTDQTRGRGARPFEVQLDEADGFRHPTIVDGRWVYSIWRDKLAEDGTYMFTLNEKRMVEVSLAIFIGLQLDL